MYIDKKQQLNTKNISQETHAIKLGKNSGRRGFADSQGLTHLHIWNLKLQFYIVSFAQLEASVMISKLALCGHIYKIQWSAVLKNFAHVAVFL